MTPPTSTEIQLYDPTRESCGEDQPEEPKAEPLSEGFRLFDEQPPVRVEITYRFATAPKPELGTVHRDPMGDALFSVFWFLLIYLALRPFILLCFVGLFDIGNTPFEIHKYISAVCLSLLMSPWFDRWPSLFKVS